MKLRLLDVTFNKLKYDSDIACLSKLSQLTTVLLYGNPICEVPDECYVASPDGKTVVDVVIEEPNFDRNRKDIMTYNNFSIATIRDDFIPTAGQWKAAGNATLFGTNQEGLGGLMEKPEVAIAAPEPSANKEDEGDRAKRKGLGGLKDGDGFFMTEAFLEDGGGTTDDDEDPMSEYYEDLSRPRSKAKKDALDEYGSLEVPDMILRRNLTANSSDPVVLRTAINSLRYALKHPLTTHDDVGTMTVS